MKKARLLKLANFLEFLPADEKEHFDMGLWFTLNGSRAQKMAEKLPVLSEVVKDAYDSGYADVELVDVQPNTLSRCGTAACALGWACAMPEFQKKGLRTLRKRMSGSGEVSLCPYFEGERNMEAGQKFFGLTEGQAFYLFLPSYYGDHPQYGRNAPPERVAKRIRVLVHNPHLVEQDARYDY